MCEEYYYDNTQISQKLGTDLWGAQNVAGQQCLPKNTFVETKKTLFT